MFLRISNLCCAALVLAGCGTEASEPVGENVDCAIGPGAEFSSVCTLEQTAIDEFVIHHPDGGFRRFRLNDQGEPTLADGADEFSIGVMASEDGPVAELNAGRDRYRILQEDFPQFSDE